MAQNFTADWYELTYNVDQAFINAENNDNVLRSNFSGVGAPTSPVNGQNWFDETTGVMKIRGNAGAWVASLTGANTFKTYVYSNVAQYGWVIDSTVVDRVLSLVGGNYGSVGGVEVGSWNHATGLSGTANTGGLHSHQWKDYNGFQDLTWDASNGIINISSLVAQQFRTGIIITATSANPYAQNLDYFTNRHNGHTHSLTITSNSAYRPYAAVGTLQNPNI